MDMTLYETIYEKVKGSGIGEIPVVARVRSVYVRGLGLTKKPIKVNGYTMQLDDEDSMNLLVDRYEPASTKFIKNSAKGVGLDLGANIGYYTLLMGGLCRKVYAFEPCTKTYGVLKKNIELNAMRNVTAIKAAVGDRQETRQMNQNIRTLGAASFVEQGKWQGKKEEVDVVRLDDYFRGKRKPDIIKMDVEGWEEEAIKGGRQTFGHAKIILFESNAMLLKKRGKKENAVITMLQNMGFRVDKSSLKAENNLIARKA
jgi:FkbM family methyltransferase